MATIGKRVEVQRGHGTGRFAAKDQVTEGVEGVGIMHCQPLHRIGQGVGHGSGADSIEKKAKGRRREEEK